MLSDSCIMLEELFLYFATARQKLDFLIRRLTFVWFGVSTVVIVGPVYDYGSPKLSLVHSGGGCVNS
jgi:hypothetical protein